jgi:predicted ATPase
VLDNCEHLLEAAAHIVAHLMRECPRLRIVATSREALSITGEIVWRTPALAAPHPRHLPQGRTTLLRVLSSYDSVALFVERAQSYQKGFALTEHNALAVATVCSQLEGMPLSIEFAAARVAAMSVEQIAARLNDHLGLLTTGSRTAQPRQQTLRATLDWSYGLLGEPERLLLQRLSVFAGGWKLEAAEQVCFGQPIESVQVLNLLSSLVDKSLVAYEERDAEGAGRFRLLETVRQYAAERLRANNEEHQAKARHLNWCLAVAEEVEPHLSGGPQQAAAMRRLEAEHDNLRVALDWRTTEAHEIEIDLRLASGLWRYWNMRGNYSEGRYYMQGALTRDSAPAVTQVRAKALNGAATLALNQGDLDSAQTMLTESLDICRTLEYKPGLALATANLASIARSHGDLTTAQAQFEESLRLCWELGDRCGTASQLSSLGEMAYNRGDIAGAQGLFGESLRLLRELGDNRGIANVLRNLGHEATMRGDYAAGQIQLEEALRLSTKVGDTHNIANTLSDLGNMLSRQGDHATARIQYEESLRIRRHTGNKLGVAYALINIGSAAIKEGDYDGAKSQFEESLLLCRQSEDKLGVAYSLINLGEVVSHQGDTVLARRQLEEGLRLCRELGDKRGIAQALENMAGTLPAEADGPRVTRLFGAAEALRQSISAPLSLIEQQQYDQQVAQVRAVLGAAAFTDAWEDGAAMTWEQATEYALAG